MKSTVFDRFLHYIYRKSNSWVVIGCSGSVAAILFYVMHQRLPKEVFQNLWAFQLTINPATMDRILNQWGVSGIQAFLGNMGLDTAFPICYAIFFIGSLSKCLNKPFDKLGLGMKWMLLVPILALAFDFVENGMEMAFLVSYPNLDPALMLMGAAAAALKWVCVGMVLLIIALNSLKRLIHLTS